MTLSERRGEPCASCGSSEAPVWCFCIAPETQCWCTVKLVFGSAAGVCFIAGYSYTLSEVEAVQTVNGAPFVSVPPGVLSIEPDRGREGSLARRLSDGITHEYEPRETETSAGGNFWRAAIPLMSSGIERDTSGPLGERFNGKTVEPGDLVVILCLGNGSGLVAVPPDYARMLTGEAGEIDCKSKRDLLMLFFWLYTLLDRKLLEAGAQRLPGMVFPAQRCPSRG